MADCVARVSLHDENRGPQRFWVSVAVIDDVHELLAGCDASSLSTRPYRLPHHRQASGDRKYIL